MFIDTIPEESASGALAEVHQQQSALGFLPSFAEAFSTRPEVARAWSLLNTTVRGGMDCRRFEIATIGLHQVKSGYVSLRSGTSRQIEKDAVLRTNGDEIVWHFVASDRTGGMGADLAVPDLLDEVGIPCVVHLP